MRAVVYDHYGAPDVLRIVDLPDPEPGPGEVRVRVRATTVNAKDWRLRSMTVPPGFGLIARAANGFGGPRQPVLGSEVAGVVDAVGDGVTEYGLGDPVFGYTQPMGAHAERVCLPASAVVPKPAALSFEQAAALSFGGFTALDFLERGDVEPGEHLLVNGASGCVGTATVQIAAARGVHVTGVCSPPNLELVRSLGAASVVDYTTADFADTEARFDAVMDTVGNAPYQRVRPILQEGGRLLLVMGTVGDMLRAPALPLATSHRIVAGHPDAAELPRYRRTLADLAARGDYVPVIDAVFPFDHIRDAHARVDTGHKVGNVVVTLP